MTLDKIRANQIAAKALQTRKKYLGAGANEPICPFNLADAMGFDVRFVKISSFEGMYLAGEGVILVSAERPEGRKSFTCAHEIGHHVLGHGTVIDEIIENGSDKEIEKEADFFASMLLMPSSAVNRAGKDMGVNFKMVNSQQIYILSKYLGVSYRALIIQLRYNLKLISTSQFKSLENPQLGEIKKGLCKSSVNGEVFIVGDWWYGRAIDVVVGDVIVAGSSSLYEGLSISVVNSAIENHEFLAESPGMAKLSNEDGWSAFVRVSRKGFSGMNQFRHEEEVE